MTAVGAVLPQDRMRRRARACEGVEDDGVFFRRDLQDAFDCAHWFWIRELIFVKAQISEQLCSSLTVDVLKRPYACGFYEISLIKVLPLKNTPLFFIGHIASV